MQIEAVVDMNQIISLGLNRTEAIEYVRDQILVAIDFWITNPIQKKYYLALLKIASEKRLPIFHNLKAVEIIKLATGKTSSQIRQRDRVQLTNALRAWNMIQLKVLKEKNVSTSRRNGKKMKLEESKYIYTKLFNLNEEVVESVTDPETGQIIEDATIKEISGYLPIDFKMIGAYIPEGIFKLDAKGNRINLAFSIWRRANQVSWSKRIDTQERYHPPNFKMNPVRWDRKKWIQEADLTHTDSMNKTMANKLLLETFKEFRELGIIQSYPTELSLNDDEKITIYLPDVLKE